METTGTAPAVVPSSPREFGDGLRRLRSVGLRRLASRQRPGAGRLVLSKSQLNRYERGESLPPLQYAEHLDELYEAQGWVVMSLRTLWRPRWNPWAEEHGVAARLHAGGWPALYRGVVWIKVKPLPENVLGTHRIVLDWGPWTQAISLTINVEGVTLLTGKETDESGVATPCNLSADLPVFTLYGIGDRLDGEHVIDIRSGWSWRQAPS